MSDMTAKEKDGLISGLLGGAIFLVFFLIVDAGILLSILSAAAAFAVGYFLLFRVKAPEVLAAETDVRNSLNDAVKKLDSIEKLRKQITKPAVSSKVLEVEMFIKKIISQVAKEPATLKKAEMFFGYSTHTFSRKRTEKA